jgi:hypothetical protein
LLHRLSFALALITALCLASYRPRSIPVRDDLRHQAVLPLSIIRSLLARWASPQATSSSFADSILGYLIATRRRDFGEEILPRLNPRAASQCDCNGYTLRSAASGFSLGVAASGVEMSKFTILTGAFGVALASPAERSHNFPGLICFRTVRIGDSLEIEQ